MTLRQLLRRVRCRLAFGHEWLPSEPRHYKALEFPRETCAICGVERWRQS